MFIVLGWYCAFCRVFDCYGLIDVYLYATILLLMGLLFCWFIYCGWFFEVLFGLAMIVFVVRMVLDGGFWIVTYSLMPSYGLFLLRLLLFVCWI